MPPWLGAGRIRVALLALGALWLGDARRVDPTTAPVAGVRGDERPAVAAPSPIELAARPIAAWVVDGAGAPIAGVRVRFRDAAVATSDASGAGSVIATSDASGAKHAEHAAGSASPRVDAAEVIATSDASGALRFVPPAGGKRALLLDGPGVFPAEVLWHAGDPPRIVLAKRAELAVRVTAGGAPVADAEVQITDGSRPALATARTDRNGTARFGDLLPGPYELWARRDRAVSALARVDVADRAAAALALEPAGCIHGQVIGDGPLPADASVVLAPLDVDHATRTAALDGDGRFSVGGMPRGRWRVEVRAAGYVDSTDRVIQARGDRDDIALELVRAGAVTGIAVDAAGNPVANATIVLRRQDAATVASTLGEPRVLASARLRWVHPLAGGRRLLPGIEAGRFGAPRPGSRPAECGRGHCGIDIGSLRGQVVHAAIDGEVIGAYREIHGEAGRLVALSHGDGLVTMYMHLDELRAGLEVGQRVRAGDALGTIGTTGFALDVPHLHFAVTQERDGRIWYLDPEPMLRHAVVLPVARPLDRIGVDPRNVVAAVRWSELGGAAGTTAARTPTTDAHGRFRLDGIAPGTYVAVGFAEGLAPGVSTSFVVRNGGDDAGDTAGIVVTLRTGVLVRGRVLGRDGAIAGATIIAAAGFGETANKVAMTYSDHAGEFVLRALSGRVTLTASAPGHGDAERTLALDDAQAQQQRADFTLQIQDAQLRGQVLAPDGGAAGPVAIRIVDGPTHRSGTSDPLGRFTIDRLAGGGYLIEATAADYPPLRARLQTGTWRELRFEAGGGVRVFLRDARSTAPLAGVRVEATGPGAATASGATDARGAVELRGLAVGDWSVVARPAGYAPATRAIAIASRRVSEDLIVDLARGVTLGGVVRDRYGRRVAGAKVSLGTAVTRTDGDGNFQLDGAPPGDGWLLAELAGARGAVQVDTAPGDTRLTLTIELRE